MFKKSKYFLIVDSVENAIKFYGDKLLFTVTDLNIETGVSSYINYAELKRGKCFLVIRSPSITELAEFSMVRRLTNRTTGLYLELKKGLEAFFKACKKKKLNITTELTRHPMGYTYFLVMDPFGSMIYFYQLEKGFHSGKSMLVDKKDFFGLRPRAESWDMLAKGNLPRDVADYLKGFGLTRRIAKKFVKAKFSKKVKGDA